MSPGPESVSWPGLPVQGRVMPLAVAARRSCGLAGHGHTSRLVRHGRSTVRAQDGGWIGGMPVRADQIRRIAPGNALPSRPQSVMSMRDGTRRSSYASPCRFFVGDVVLDEQTFVVLITPFCVRVRCPVEGCRLVSRYACPVGTWRITGPWSRSLRCFCRPARGVWPADPPALQVVLRSVESASVRGVSAGAADGWTDGQLQLLRAGSPSSSRHGSRLRHRCGIFGPGGPAAAHAPSGTTSRVAGVQPARSADSAGQAPCSPPCSSASSWASGPMTPRRPALPVARRAGPVVPALLPLAARF